MPDDQIITFQIFEASSTLYCHIFDYDEIINDKPPLRLYSIYCKGQDELYVYFTDNPFTEKLQNLEDNILLLIGNEGKLNGLLFRNASNKIAKEFSKEAKERIIRRYELASRLRKLASNSSKSNEKKCCIS